LVAALKIRRNILGMADECSLGEVTVLSPVLPSELEVLPSYFYLANAGDSFKLKRKYTEMASNRIDTNNGIRQLQSAKASSPISVRLSKITIRDSNRPKAAVV
jgi:hypothetical protein